MSDSIPTNTCTRCRLAKVGAITLSIVAASSVSIGIASSVRTVTITYAIAPHSYEVRLLKGTLSIERTLNSPKSQPPHYVIEAPAKFDQSFYDHWYRVYDAQRI